MHKKKAGLVFTILLLAVGNVVGMCDTTKNPEINCITVSGKVLATDCLGVIFEFLDFKELCRLERTSKGFLEAGRKKCFGHFLMSLNSRNYELVLQAIQRHQAIKFRTYGNKFTDERLKRLAMSEAIASKFERLALYEPKDISAEGFLVLAALKNLKSLTLSYSKITDDGLKILPMTLKQLNLSGCKEISGLGFLALARFGGLKKLDLGNTEITDNGLKILPITLKELGLSSCRKISGLGFLDLARFMELKKLGLGYTEITDDVLKILPITLEELGLSGCKKISGLGFLNLARFRGLKKLGLGDTEITDNGMQKLPNTLEYLNLDECSEITVACFVVFEGLKNLKNLYINRTRIFDEEMKQLVPKLPNTKIEYWIDNCS